MDLHAIFEFRVSIDPEADIKQLQAGCDARAPGCKVSVEGPKLLLTVPMEQFCVLRDYIALWHLGDMSC